MSGPDLEIYPDTLTLFRMAAEKIMGALRASLQENRDTTFVLAGGETPRGVYKRLAESCERPDWTRTHFFWGDERCVPPDDKDSNFRMAHESLLSRLSVPAGNIHRIVAEMEDGERAALLYEEEIRKTFPAPALPTFDLVLLGMGEDGHTASLFPGTHWDEERLVILSYGPRPPFRRISMTPRLLNAARRVIFLVSGQAKAPALRRVLRDPGCDCPAAKIRPATGSLTWMADSAAASLLR